MAVRVLVLGGDGYLGWPTAMYLSQRGFEVGVVDSFHKRFWEMRIGVQPLAAPPLFTKRAQIWEEVTGRKIRCWVIDLTERNAVEDLFREFRPDAIVHYAEQPSAPFSMIDGDHAVLTQENNVTGNLNVMFAMRDIVPNAHLVKLGTMGEYGTPNIDIEEGYLEVEHNGRRDRLPFPKQPGSFYHLSKVHDSHNLYFATRSWNLRVTDLNQGVVYGVETEETAFDERLGTSFHYDAIFGTVLNRFCVQAVLGVPLTVYGSGGQQRGFLNIRDTLRCVELAIRNPADPGEFRVFNQFTEQFSVLELAERVVSAAGELGIQAEITHLPNPRVESENHYYNPKNSGLMSLGLEPHLLSDELVRSMLAYIAEKAEEGAVDRSLILPDVRWTGGKMRPVAGMDAPALLEVAATRQRS